MLYRNFLLHEVLFIVSLNGCATWALFKKSFSEPMSSSLSATFSPIGFRVSGLKLRSLIHLESSFAQGDRDRSIFIVLHVAVQLDQYHLLKALSFLQCAVWALSKVRCPYYVWLCSVFQFYFIDQYDYFCVNTMQFLFP